jgi:hypothetical protein
VNVNTFLIIRHVRIVNRTNATAYCAFWLGGANGNAGGTEVLFAGSSAGSALTSGTGVAVPGNSFVEVYPLLRLDVGEFLVGGAGVGSTLTFEAEGEVGIV